MANKVCITDIPVEKLHGLTALVRVDFNCPITSDIPPKVTDSSKLRATIPTLEYLIACNLKIVLCSHLGRPNGKDPSQSLELVARNLNDLMGDRVIVKFVNDCIGDMVTCAISELNMGEILILENTRFYKEEEKNDREFSEKLSKNINIYINDAFGTAHRAHASTTGVTAFVPLSVSGLLMTKELKFLGGCLYAPKRPLTAVVGGKKVSTKINVLKTLLGKVDNLLVCGGMVFTFLKAQGKDVGKSYVEKDSLPTALEILNMAHTKGINLILAEDSVVTMKITADAETKIVRSDNIPEDWIGVDVGPATVYTFSNIFAQSKTILWNGPPGIFEMTPFASGTFGLIDAMSNVTGLNKSEEFPDGIITVACGGDTLAAVDARGQSNFTHLSTGGGAALELLEGLALPGVEALSSLESDSFREFIIAS